MNTKVLLPTDKNIEYAASLLNQGELVGIPTETVYGLAANALDADAVSKIFVAKGRPQDNPLIVHISNIQMLSGLVSEVPDVANQLAAKFWPGPLTLIMKKNDNVPECVTAGLDTVAVRFPSHKIAQKLISTANIPLAAPSANLSGSPSPSEASHVYDDLNGRIPAIIDGGDCEFGLESTVVIPHNDGKVTLLRPGAITVEMLKTVATEVVVDKGVLHEVSADEKVSSPGMKHTHYSPNAKVYIIDSDFDKFLELVNSNRDKSIGVMVFDNESKFFDIPCVSYGDHNDSQIQAKLLFKCLRTLDTFGVDTIYARMPSQIGMGLAVYNRLLRAAGFEVISL